MIYSPMAGLHENVAVLDYENEYANLILKNNLSYETLTSTMGQNSKGLLPSILETVLKRRIFFKGLQKSFLINTRETAVQSLRNRTRETIIDSIWLHAKQISLPTK
jgi:DNA polymerase elongation subunit (family B)